MKNQKKEIKEEALASLPVNKSNSKKRKIMNSGKIVLGILASFGLGALIGIVFSPQKGTKTRRKIIKKGENYIDNVKEQIEVLLDETVDKIEQKWKQKVAPAIKESNLDHGSDLKKTVH